MSKLTVTVEVEEDWIYHYDNREETRQRNVEIFKQVVEDDAASLVRAISRTINEQGE